MSLELVIKENTEVMRQLIAAMQSGKAFTPDTPPQPKTDSASVKKEERKGPFWWKSLDGLKTGVADDTTALKAIIDANAGIEITKVEYLQLQEKPEKEAPDIESLDIRIITALANLFGAKAKNLTSEQVEKARAYENGNKRDQFTDALSLALIDCKAAKNTTRAVILDLCIVMLAHWSAMETIDERQAFAELYIKTPYNKRAGLIPQKAEPEAITEPETNEPDQDTAALFEQARTLVMKLTTGGYRNEAVEILNKFGAQKLAQVPQENLADVVMLAEAALQGE
ncbi:hypothetical protein BL250_07645 [Erwinia sp. OLTSP20]|uniref:hypothetical protein n=1 Tax=unclassified Erwinia TaxID=2622719 RepID=UPI000C17C760|nr:MULTISPECIES: hypothetical protein [unclassified Erwinia]PIJ50657.1 hypothetical protein BV501_07830 [Erwinia sp. OAMSP11]PIJ72703.1 hypothetical protein BK416_08700 [Erwinia sp. OLSSP12]PIJ83215.1 hypothetical protein BLD47_05060 [Erwinia sp. OLCASP19]PIJ85284.1 hypothetical protein BLD46_06670 [Erwinia sp. OLMTSP26]PIJ87286.1 hypothetical protein BLD49_06685 [Erwinia sp. OLMDSP33]